jgi:N-acetylornithine carbamoyltransferase
MKHLIDWHLTDQATWEGRIEAAMRVAELAASRGRPAEGGLRGQGASSAEGRSRTARAFRGEGQIRPAEGRSLALLFFNSSLRTRTSMEVAAARLGAHSSLIVPGQGTWGFAWEDGVEMVGEEAEHIQEAAGVLSQYFDAIGVRLFASLKDQAADREERLLARFVRAATVPVINLESAYFHPCQALADAATITEHFGGNPAGKRFVLAWAAHPKALPTAVPNSALLMAARLGMKVTVARPEGFELDPAVMERARQYGPVEETDDLDGAMAGAQVVYAKAWASRYVYKEPAEDAALRSRHRDWRITADRMATSDEAAFMHCLPVRRGVVVDDAVLDGPQAIHLRQAAYRLFAQQAILSWIWDLPEGGAASAA